MDDEVIATLAKLAGLDIAWRDYQDDVRLAAAQALARGGAIAFPVDPAAEPWPPMQAKPQP